MNSLECRMMEILCELKDKYHVVGVKAEFEAEGTRMEEAQRLKDVTTKAGLGMNIKIGGCEAIKDMFDAIALGSERIIAPMVESAYALKKFLAAINLVYSADLRNNVEFLINLETITACRNFPEMLRLPEIEQLDGVVIGRVDLTGSMGLTREDINSGDILMLSLEMAALAKEHDLDVVVGGGVSVHSQPFFRAFPRGHLDRFETRKIVFSCPAALSNPEEAFLKAVEFELLWLKNKKEFYGQIYREDDARIQMLERRYQDAIAALGEGRRQLKLSA
ncbi:MAG TPA: aldolase/citrate lyase family protein [Gemmataceae bacterium]|nr:aldolase/citrate lyase family protein [Gemmataceae bacterium]